VRCQLTDHAEAGRRQGANLRRRAAGLGEQQRDLERPALWRGQTGQRVVKRHVQQVAQRGERELALGHCRLAAEHPVARRAGDLDSGPPQRGLADPGVALEYERGGERSARRDELAQSRELGLAPYDRVGQSFVVALKNRGTSPISPPPRRS
jgi:hypothetical protein